MVAMESPEGEVVPFVRPVHARGNAETWLQHVLTGMQVRFWVKMVGFLEATGRFSLVCGISLRYQMR